MTIEEIYKKTAEGFDALQFNIGLLFDEMEKGLNQRKLPLCKKLWYKARLSIMRKQYRKTTHLIRFGCRFLDLKYINEITYIRSMQVIGVFEEEGHYRWEMSGNGGIRDKADISPVKSKESKSQSGSSWYVEISGISCSGGFLFQNIAQELPVPLATLTVQGEQKVFTTNGTDFHRSAAMAYWTLQRAEILFEFQTIDIIHTTS